MQPENKPISSDEPYELETEPRKGGDGPKHRLANSPASKPKSKAGAKSKPSHAAAGHIQSNSDGGQSQIPNQTVAANPDTGVATPGAELSPMFDPTTLKHYSAIAPLYCLVLHALSLSEHYEDEGASELNERNDRRNKLAALLNEYVARCPSEPKLSEYSKTIRNICSLIATALQVSLLNDPSVEADNRKRHA